jgi:hypothetical protein
MYSGPRHEPSARGCRILYRSNATTYCPGCGHAHWYVGRASAECAFCATVLPIAEQQGAREYALAG